MCMRIFFSNSSCCLLPFFFRAPLRSLRTLLLQRGIGGTPKPKPCRAPDVAPVPEEGLGVEAGGSRQCCVDPASSAAAAAAPATKAPCRLVSLLHGRTKASHEVPSPSSPPAPAVGSSDCTAGGGA